MYMNGGLSKIRSLHAHTYVMYRMFYFERYCTDKVEENSSTKPFKALHAVHSVQPKAIIRVKRWQMVDMIYILLFFDDIFAKFLLSISENVKYQYNFFLFYPFCIIQAIFIQLSLRLSQKPGPLDTYYRFNQNKPSGV